MGIHIKNLTKLKKVLYSNKTKSILLTPMFAGMTCLHWKLTVDLYTCIWVRQKYFRLTHSTWNYQQPHLSGRPLPPWHLWHSLHWDCHSCLGYTTVPPEAMGPPPMATAVVGLGVECWLLPGWNIKFISFIKTPFFL